MKDGKAEGAAANGTLRRLGHARTVRGEVPGLLTQPAPLHARRSGESPCRLTS